MEKTEPKFILINKPAGWTSFDVVNFIRKKVQANTRHPEEASQRPKDPLESQGILRSAQNDKKKKRIKVGHAGTLDPFATGLLIVGVGREATRRLDEFKGMPKTYVAKLHLGAVSDSFDVTGTIRETRNVERGTLNDDPRYAIHDPEIPTTGRILSILESFKGTQHQLPPMFSAKKVNGQRLYKLARQGKEVEREPCEIEIYSIKMVEYGWPYLTIEVSCSAGTYIRTLASDIGEKLGVGAYCKELTRTSIGDYTLSQAKNLSTLTTICHEENRA